MTRMCHVVVLVIAGLTLACPAPGGEGRSDGAVVRIDAGMVRGSVHDEYWSFHGIPYAAPPLGELRWSSPQPVSAWTDTRHLARSLPGGAVLSCRPSTDQPAG